MTLSQFLVRLQIGPIPVPVNSEIVITDIGRGGMVSQALACFTDGIRRDDADWLFPNGTALPKETRFADPDEILSIVQPIAITLHRGNSVLSPTGQYCCVIPPNITYNTMEVRLCVNTGKFTNKQ